MSDSDMSASNEVGQSLIVFLVEGNVKIFFLHYDVSGDSIKCFDNGKYY